MTRSESLLKFWNSILDNETILPYVYNQMDIEDDGERVISLMMKVLFLWFTGMKYDMDKLKGTLSDISAAVNKKDNKLNSCSTCHCIQESLGDVEMIIKETSSDFMMDKSNEIKSSTNNHHSNSVKPSQSSKSVSFLLNEMRNQSKEDKVITPPELLHSPIETNNVQTKSLERRSISPSILGSDLHNKPSKSGLKKCSDMVQKSKNTDLMSPSILGSDLCNEISKKDAKEYPSLVKKSKKMNFTSLSILGNDLRDKSSESGVGENYNIGEKSKRMNLIPKKTSAGFRFNDDFLKNDFSTLSNKTLTMNKSHQLGESARNLEHSPTSLVTEDEVIAELQQNSPTTDRKARRRIEVKRSKKMDILQDSFDIPRFRKTPSPEFAYQHPPERKKQRRKILSGCDCKECEDYFDLAASLNSSRQEILNRCSRHRSKHRPVTNTPEGFWNPEFDDE